MERGRGGGNEGASDAYNSLAWLFGEEKWEIIIYIYIYMYVCEVLTTVFRRSIIHNVDMVKIYMDSVLDFLSPSHHRF